jgi:phosphate/sulfate permease
MAGASNFSMLVTLASMVLSMWVICPLGAVLLLFIMILFLLFMVQYYGDITRSLVTQPLSNRQKKTENDKPGQKNSREALFPAIL